MFSRLKRASFALALTFLTIPAVGHAQIPTTDAANLTQTIQVVANGVQQLNSLATQIQNQNTQIQNQQLMLNGVGGNAFTAVGTLNTEVQGLMSQVANVNQLYQTFPKDFDNANPMTIRATLMSIQSALATANDLAVKVQGRVSANQAVVSSQVQSAVQMSNTATGPTGVGQATNQLLGIQSQQLGDVQSLLMAQQQREAAERAAADARNAAFSSQLRSGLQATGVQTTP